MSDKARQDRVVESFTSPDGQERVLIVQRPDKVYSYRRQWHSAKMNNNPDSPIFEAGAVAPGDWGPPGPYCGIYDSQHTAEQEAFHRVPWLANRRPH
jgi:hypothetical protein